VTEALANGYKSRQTQWTDSIAVGNKGYVETLKEKLGVLCPRLYDSCKWWWISSFDEPVCWFGL